jgi:hypothetical protein
MDHLVWPEANHLSICYTLRFASDDHASTLRSVQSKKLSREHEIPALHQHVQEKSIQSRIYVPCPEVGITATRVSTHSRLPRLACNLNIWCCKMYSMTLEESWKTRDPPVSTFESALEKQVVYCQWYYDAACTSIERLYTDVRVHRCGWSETYSQSHAQRWSMGR